MSDDLTKRNLPAVASKNDDSKTPAFGQKKLSPLREMLDGKPPDDFGFVRVIKKELIPKEGSDEGADPEVPDYRQPENTQQIALSGETMRVSLERAARGAELPATDEIPVVWGGETIPRPRPKGLLGAGGALPQKLRWVLAGFFVLSLVGAVFASIELLR